MAYRQGGGKRRRDAIEPAIIAALEQAGCQVLQLHGAGVPDLLVQVPEHWRLPWASWVPLEVKSPGGRLTRAQFEIGMRYPIVRSVNDVLALFGVSPWR